MAIGTFLYVDADGTRRAITDPLDAIAYTVHVWIDAEVVNDTDTTAWLHESEDGDGRSRPLPPGDRARPDYVASVVFS
ncbi:hypothetical protein [Nocardia sp. BMG51109]|uniref:hypothetical protein n=1 Tax=Nocardia sp. BMG51109 TaxID=1056816 RepID=UPI0004654581|nr:hypothetical protein [Nocardia sp. BMG51109]